MSEFDGIQGLEAWDNKLKSLLAEAKLAAAKGSEGEAERKSLSDRLVEFVTKSRPNDDAILALDDLAGRAAIDLLRTTIEGRVMEITARSAELAGLAKQFESLAAKGKAEASSIRLDKVREVAEGLTSAAATLRGFKATLTEGDDKQLAAAVEKGIKTVQDLRKLVEEKGPLPQA